VTGHFLQNAVIFLLAAVISVPLAKRWGLGAVLGYLAAGVAIGPQGFKLIENLEQTAQISELGVVLLLFVIGLELSPQRLWVMRRAVFGAGTLQVLFSAAAIGGIAFALGLSWKGALVTGAALALSSTAIGLQTLAERKELNTGPGRTAFAILLFQDVAAIPILAMIPLLAMSSDTTPSGLAALKVIGVIAAVIVGGRLLLRPLFRIVAQAQSVETFTATALLIVIAAAWVMELAGISMSLGAFLAGMLLADSEFRHELESHIEPFKGLLLGLFFISVGMSVDLTLIAQQPLLVAALVLTLLIIKALILVPIGRLAAGLDRDDAFRLAVLLAGGGEFAFVVLNLAQSGNLLLVEQRNLLVVAVTLSMAATPLLVLGLARWLAGRPRTQRPHDEIDLENPRVIIAGFGRVGQIVARILRAHHIPFTALEASAEQVESSRQFGSKIYFGDPSRPELLRAAHADRAEIFVLATDDPEANVRTARIVKRQYPHLKVFARARNRQHVFRLMDLKVEGVIRETLHSSLEMARQVLEALGYDAATAAERVERFRLHDENLLQTQYLVYDDEAALVQSTQEALIDLERLFEADQAK
jgi:glutathione-regulated potassium-efflux system protein KefB